MRLIDDQARVLSRLRPVLGVLLVTSLVGALVQAPLAAGALRLFLARTGRASAGNFEIAAFLLSPPGLAALVVVGALGLAQLFLQLALLIEALAPRPRPLGPFLAGLPGWLLRTFRLGLLKLLGVLALALPLAGGAAFAVRTAWAGRDINGLLVLRPPEFWQGIAWTAPLLLLLVAGVLALTARWMLALPLLEADPGLSPRAALRLSAERTRGRRWRMLGELLGWALPSAAVLGAVAWILQTACGAALDAWGGTLASTVLVAGLLLSVSGITLALLAGLALAGLAARLARLAGTADAGPGTVIGNDAPDAADGRAARAPRARLRAAALLLLVLFAGALLAARLLLRDAPRDEPVEVTAHRAGAARAPENTLAALRLAIEDGADWAEIDVQRAADDVLVVLHDLDLARIGGGPRRVRATPSAEIRALDVGTALGMPTFAGERVPTLEEVVAAAAGRIRLNIELKPAGADDVAPLTDAVLAVVRAAGRLADTTLCSQSYEALRRAKAAAPGLRVGYIAGAALGDVTRLGVDFLMLSRAQVTRALVDRAHARGQAVYAWTINDPDHVPPLLDLGVDNVITDRPQAVRARIGEVEALDPAERILLRARHALAR